MTELYNLLTQDKPTWIDGRDFVAFNYGKTPYTPDTRMIKIRSEQVSYETSTPKKDFPDNVRFNRLNYKMPFVNVDHVGDIIREKVSLSLDEAISTLQKEGWEFEGRTNP